jgi:tetratricopeptide (TPR) repeat protein
MKDAEFYFKRGRENNILNRYQEAVDDYTRAIQLNPPYLDAFLQRGTLCYKILKRYEEALTDFDKAIEIDPGCASAYLHRGIVKCHLLKFSEALVDFDKTIELDPNEERAYFNRGKNKYMLKYEEEEVRSDLEKAICLGAPQAADMLKLFYSQNQEVMRKDIENRVKNKASQLKIKKGDKKMKRKRIQGHYLC